VPAPVEAPGAANVRCPTCRAVQEWSDACRRCKCDLRLLRALAGAYHRARRACLRHLSDGHPDAAWRAAGRCRALSPSEESLRLMAVSALLRGDHAAAAALARSLLPPQGPPGSGGWSD
jgi:hypothetical protein